MYRLLASLKPLSLHFCLVLLTVSISVKIHGNPINPIITFLLDDAEIVSPEMFDTTVVPIPLNGAYHGVYTTENIPGGASQYTVAGRLYGISEFEKSVYQTGEVNSKRVAFDRQFYKWDTLVKNNDLHPYIYATSSLGRIPVVSLYSQLQNGTSLVCPDGSAKLAWPCIAAGHFDTHIIDIALKIRDSELPRLIFSFVHEPEDEMRCDPNKGDLCMGTAPEYIAAWRQIVNIFRAENVNNVDFMWIVRSNIFTNNVPQGFPTADQAYPGDDYIDWISADVYNYSFRSGGVYQWRSLEEIAGDFYQWGAAHPKPLAFAEWGSREEYFNVNNDGSRKAQWFTEGQNWLKTEATRIKALMYFNRFPENEFNNPDPLGNTGPNWKVDTTVNSMNGYRALAQDPYFKSACSIPPTLCN